MTEAKTILITGGAGALGSNAVERYLNEGHKVIALDSLQKTRDTRNIDEFLGNKNFTFIKHDITNSLPENVTSKKIDWILNLACPVSCIDLQVDPIHTMRSCTDGLLNILDLAKEQNAVIFQASSADIYGEMFNDTPFKEDDHRNTIKTTSARACYEEGKRAAETLCKDHNRMHGTRVKIGRIFNTTGPKTLLTDGRVISNFVLAAMANREVTIYGDGSATRCFLATEENVDAIDKLMQTSDEFTGPINIGNNQPITMLELAEKIIKLTNSKSRIIFTEADDAPQFRRPDISLAKKILNWEPKVSTDEMLEKTVNYYKEVGLPEKNVLVFSTTYYPMMGPAEHALAELAQQMNHIDFHVITAKMQPGLAKTQRIGNIKIHRVGFGNSFDKFLLPILGTNLAAKLHVQNKYRFMWSIVPSYGGIIAAFMKRRFPNISFIVAGQAKSQNSLKKKVIKLISNQADIIYDDQATEEAGFTEEVRTAYRTLVAKQEGKLLRPVLD